jgi:biopolymer transport protein ExbB
VIDTAVARGGVTWPLRDSADALRVAEPAPGVAPGKEHQMSITETFKSFTLLGAEWVMWVLVALSVVSIAIMIERILYFAGQRPNVGVLVADLRKALAGGDLAAARARLENAKGVTVAVARAMLDDAPLGPTSASESGASAATREKLKLERNLSYLGTVGNNAPFIGLFGTVIGIIQAFHDLSLNTKGGAATVMSGISEALVATAMGLLVAIPAVIAFNVFQRRIRAIMGDTESLQHALLAALSGASGDAPKKG